MSQRIKEFVVDVGARGCERLTIKVSGIREDGTKIFELANLDGNTTGAALWGAREAIKAVNEILSRESNEGQSQS